MADYPQFMQNPDNRIDTSSATPGMESYAWHGADGSQALFSTCTETAIVPQHAHDHDEYLLVVEGCYVVLMQGRSIELKPGQEHFIPGGVAHAGKVFAGTRSIQTFGGKGVTRD